MKTKGGRSDPTEVFCSTEGTAEKFGIVLGMFEVCSILSVTHT
jgi:hypothetical protein